MRVKHKMFPFCFTKILSQAFYMTDTSDSEVSLHYWLLWPTVRHAGFFRLLMKGILDPYVL